MTIKDCLAELKEQNYDLFQCDIVMDWCGEGGVTGTLDSNLYDLYEDWCGDYSLCLPNATTIYNVRICTFNGEEFSVDDERSEESAKTEDWYSEGLCFEDVMDELDIYFRDVE